MALAGGRRRAPPLVSGPDEERPLVELHDLTITCTSERSALIVRVAVAVSIDGDDEAGL